MTHILATFQAIIQQREKHANLPVPSPPNSPPFDFDGRNFLRSSSALTFSQRWKNANKAKGNFIEVKLLPSVRPSIRLLTNCQKANWPITLSWFVFEHFHFITRVFTLRQIAAPRCKMGSDKVSSLWQRKSPCSLQSLEHKPFFF